VVRESCYTSDDGESICATAVGTVAGWRPAERKVILEGEDLGLTFVDTRSAAVVARYFAITAPRLEEEITPSGSCQEY
jgi:hypothetical protein